MFVKAGLSTSSFIAGLGVNTHINAWLGDYGNANHNGPNPTIVDSLKYLGIGLVRDGGTSDEQYWPGYQTLIQAGIKFDIDVPGTSNSIEQTIDQALRLGNALSSIEGPNEINDWPVNYHGRSDPQAAVQFQHDLYSAIKSTPALASIPVYNLTEDNWGPGAYTPLGNMLGSADYENVHSYARNDNPNYPANQPPGFALQYALNSASSVTPGLPIVITETGYNQSPVNGGVNADVQEKYTLDDLMDTAKAGVQKTFLYELLDDNPDPGQTYGENHWGLFDGWNNPKPVATGIHNLTTILSHGADSTLTSALLSQSGLDYSLSGGDSTVASLLLQKASGVFDLSVWAEPSIWQNGAEVIAPNQTIALHLAQASSVQIFDPTLGTSAIQNTYGTNFNLQVSDHPLIVEITQPTLNSIKLEDINGMHASLSAISSGSSSYLAKDSGLTQDVKQTVGSNGVDTISTPLWNSVKTVSITDINGASYATNAFAEVNATLSGAAKGSLLLTNAQHGTLSLDGGNYNVTINAHTASADPVLNHFVITTGSGESTITLRGDRNYTHGDLSTGSGHSVFFGASGGNTVTFGSGRAEVTGGVGSDSYVYHANSGIDIVQNFDSAHDTVTVDSSLKNSLHISHGAEGTTLMFGSAQHELVLHAVQNFDSGLIHWN